MLWHRSVCLILFQVESQVLWYRSFYFRAWCHVTDQFFFLVFGPGVICCGTDQFFLLFLGQVLRYRFVCLILFHSQVSGVVVQISLFGLVSGPGVRCCCTNQQHISLQYAGDKDILPTRQYRVLF